MSKAYTCQISEYVSRPTEFVKYYHQNPFKKPPKLYFNLIEKEAHYIPLLSGALQRALIVNDVLGPWCAERALELAVHDTSQKFRYSRDRLSMLDDRMKNCEEMERKLEEIEEQLINSSELGNNVPAPEENELSPKIIALFEVLEKFRKTERSFSGIIFCQQRCTACVLAMAIKH